MAQRAFPSAPARRLAVAALIAALALAGCGRKGPLELPPTATGTPRAATATDTSVGRNQAQIDDPGLIQPPNKTYQTPSAEKVVKEANKPAHAINVPEPKSGKPFVLDPLL